MPRGNGTGPMGMGPRTGRGIGNCEGFEMPGYANPVGFARGYGGGFANGLGRGHRRMFYETGLPGWARNGYPAYTGRNTAAFDEKTFLSNQAEFLENQLQQIKERMSDLNEEPNNLRSPSAMGKRHQPLFLHKIIGRQMLFFWSFNY